MFLLFLLLPFVLGGTLLEEEKKALSQPSSDELKDSIYASLVHGVLNTIGDDVLSKTEKEDHLWFFFRPANNQDIKDVLSGLLREVSTIQKHRTTKTDELDEYKNAFLNTLVAKKYFFCEKNLSHYEEDLEALAVNVDDSFVNIHDGIINRVQNDSLLHIGCEHMKNQLLKAIGDEKFPLRIPDLVALPESQKFFIWKFPIISKHYNSLMDMTLISIAIQEFKTKPKFNDTLVDLFTKMLGAYFKADIVSGHFEETEKANEFAYSFMDHMKDEENLRIDEMRGEYKRLKIQLPQKRLDALKVAELISERANKMEEFLSIFPNATDEEKDEFEVNGELFDLLGTMEEDFGAKHIRVFEELFLREIYTRTHGLYGRMWEDIVERENDMLADAIYEGTSGKMNYKKKMREIREIVKRKREKLRAGKKLLRFDGNMKRIVENERTTMAEKLEEFLKTTEVEKDHPAFHVFLYILHFSELRNVLNLRYGEEDVKLVGEQLNLLFKDELEGLAGTRTNGPFHTMEERLSLFIRSQEGKAAEIIRDIQTAVDQYLDIHRPTTTQPPIPPSEDDFIYEDEARRLRF